MEGTSDPTTLLTGWAPPRHHPDLTEIERHDPLAGWYPSGDLDVDLERARDLASEAAGTDGQWGASIRAPLVLDGPQGAEESLPWLGPDRVRVPTSVEVGQLLPTLRGSPQLIAEAIGLTLRARAIDRETPVAHQLLGALTRCGPLFIHDTAGAVGGDATLPIVLPDDAGASARRYQLIIDDTATDATRLDATMEAIRGLQTPPTAALVWDGGRLQRLDAEGEHLEPTEPHIDLLRSVRVMVIASGTILSPATWAALEAVHERHRAAAVGVAHPSDDRPVCAWSLTNSSLLGSGGWRTAIHQTRVAAILAAEVPRTLDATHRVWHVSSRAVTVTRTGPPPMLPDLLDGTAAPRRSRLRAMAEPELPDWTPPTSPGEGSGRWAGLARELGHRVARWRKRGRTTR